MAAEGGVYGCGGRRVGRGPGAGRGEGRDRLGAEVGLVGTAGAVRVQRSEQVGGFGSGGAERTDELVSKKEKDIMVV